MEILFLFLVVVLLLFGTGPVRRLLGGCLSMALMLLIGLALLIGAAMFFA